MSIQYNILKLSFFVFIFFHLYQVESRVITDRVSQNISSNNDKESTWKDDLFGFFNRGYKSFIGMFNKPPTPIDVQDTAVNTKTETVEASNSKDTIGTEIPTLPTYVDGAAASEEEMALPSEKESESVGEVEEPIVTHDFNQMAPDMSDEITLTSDSEVIIVDRNTGDISTDTKDSSVPVELESIAVDSTDWNESELVEESQLINKYLSLENSEDVHLPILNASEKQTSQDQELDTTIIQTNESVNNSTYASEEIPIVKPHISYYYDSLLNDELTKNNFDQDERFMNGERDRIDLDLKLRDYSFWYGSYNEKVPRKLMDRTRDREEDTFDSHLENVQDSQKVEDISVESITILNYTDGNNSETTQEISPLVNDSVSNDSYIPLSTREDTYRNTIKTFLKSTICDHLLFFGLVMSATLVIIICIVTFVRQAKYRASIERFSANTYQY